MNNGFETSENGNRQKHNSRLGQPNDFKL